MSALAALIPNWFETKSLGHRQLIGRARIPGTVWHEDGIALRITLGRQPIVSELLPGTSLPKQCSERHLFSNSAFCLALNTPVADTRDTARDWWDGLAQYLLCQSTAELTGLWPLHNGLDHGMAGLHHARALELAEALGILEEYYAIHAGEQPNFSADTVARLGGERLFRTLINAEIARAEAAARYRSDAIDSMSVCCGTMKNCPYPRRFGLFPAKLPRGLPHQTWLMSTVSAGALI